MIVLSGGKTGGHIIPLIAIKNEIKDDVLYVGGKGFLEEKICEKNKIDFIGLEIKNNIKSIFNAYFMLEKLMKNKPTCIISTGGFVSVPVLIYGIVKRIPFYLLEENVIMGSTNKIFSFFSRKVFLSYPLPKMKKKYVITGQPLIKHKLEYSKYSKFRFDILIIGGSLGSKPLCELAVSLNEKYDVCLITGKYYQEYLNKCKYVFEYIDDLPNLMLQAKLIISRAGAQTTAEIFSLSKATILVPSLKTKKNHQYKNAKYFEKMGCCKVKLEDDFDDINDVVEILLSNRQVILDMQENQRKLINLSSVDKIINEIKETRK